MLCPVPGFRTDPTNPAIPHDKPLAEKIKHLLKYAKKQDGKWNYRFATNPQSLQTRKMFKVEWP